MLINEKRTYEIMDKYGIDVLIGSTEGNVAYLSNYLPESVGSFRPGGNQTFCIIPRDKRKHSTIILNIGYLASWLNCKSSVDEMWAYGTYYVESFCELSGNERRYKKIENELRITNHHFSVPLEALVFAIKDKGFSNSKIGLDEKYISPQDIGILRAEFPKADIIFAYNIP